MKHLRFLRSRFLIILACFFAFSVINGSITGQDARLQLTELPYFAVYRLAASAYPDEASATGAVLSPGIGHAGMNSDGTLIGWSSYSRPNSTVYLSDFEGNVIQSTLLDSALGTIWEMEVADDRVVFMPAGDGIWTVDSSGAYPLFTLNADIPRLSQIEVTADGSSTYFVAAQGPNNNDIFRLPNGQGTPLKIVDSEDIPCPAVERCKAVWTISGLSVSADGGALGVVISGYFVEDAAGTIIGVDHDEIVVLSGEGYRYLTDQLPLSRFISALSLSPDGSTAVFASALAESADTLGPVRWMALDTSGGSAPQLLPEQPFNLAEPALTGDGSQVLLDLAMLKATRSEGQLDLFPLWNIHTVALASTNNLAISRDGTRVAFTIGNEAVFAGAVNDAQAIADAPIQIVDVQLSNDEDLILSVITQGQVTNMSLDLARDGVLLEAANSPLRCATAPHDDGNSPDVTAADGIFTTICERQSSEAADLRIGAATARRGFVVVMDVPMSIAMRP